MRIIVFGGTGLIGSALLQNPGMQGQEVVVITRKPARKEGNGTITHGPYEKTYLEKLFTGSYGIINLAGAGIGDRLWTKKRKDLILGSRITVAGLISSLVIEAREKPEFIIQASAVGFYGSRGEEELTEESVKGSGFLPDVVVQWESAVRTGQKGAIRVMFIRTGLVLSADGGFLSPLLVLFRFYAGGHFGNGRQWMPWIHVDDEIAAILYLMKNHAASGVFNLVAPNPVRGKQFYRELGNVVNRPSWLHVPASVIRLIPFGFGKELLLTSQFVKPRRLLELGFDFRFSELDQALSNLFNDE